MIVSGWGCALSSSNKNKIAIFTGAFRSRTGFLIACATRCHFVHAAVYTKSCWWHSSEHLGCFGPVNIDAYGERDCIVFEFEGDLLDWLSRMIGCRYDWRGVFGWLAGLNNPRRFYCFEAAQSALKAAGVIDQELPRLSGCDLRDMAASDIRYGKFKDLM